MRARGFWKRCLTGKKCLYVGKKEPKVEWGLHELVLAARHTPQPTNNTVLCTHGSGGQQFGLGSVG